MKAANYFPLQSNHYSTTGAEIRMNHDAAGYGVYMMVLQKLVEVPERTLELSKINAIAFSLNVDKTLLTEVIHNYFQIDDITNTFHCDELNEKMVYFDDKYNKASEGGKKSASNLTDEQRKERAKKASETRWSKSNENAKELEQDANPLSIPLASDANNKIKENRIKEKKKEEKRTEENQTKENRTKENEPKGSQSNVLVLNSDENILDLNPVIFDKVFNNYIDFSNNFKDFLFMDFQILLFSILIENNKNINSILLLESYLNSIKFDLHFQEIYRIGKHPQYSQNRGVNNLITKLNIDINKLVNS